MLTIDPGDICDAKCIGCTNAGGKLCRRWTWLAEGKAQVPRQLLDGKCPKCAHVIALRTFSFCPYCGQALDRRNA